jgi:hypothetical protein
MQQNHIEHLEICRRRRSLGHRWAEPTETSVRSVQERQRLRAAHKQKKMKVLIGENVQKMIIHIGRETLSCMQLGSFIYHMKKECYSGIKGNYNSSCSFWITGRYLDEQQPSGAYKAVLS